MMIKIKDCIFILFLLIFVFFDTAFACSPIEKSMEVVDGMVVETSEFSSNYIPFPHLDAASFEIIQHSHFAMSYKDKHFVYLQDERLDYLDPESFTLSKDFRHDLRNPDLGEFVNDEERTAIYGVDKFGVLYRTMKKQPIGTSCDDPIVHVSYRYELKQGIVDFLQQVAHKLLKKHDRSVIVTTIAAIQSTIINTTDSVIPYKKRLQLHILQELMSYIES